MSVSHLSTVYWKIPVSATKSGAAYNPTGDTVSIAVLTSKASPADTDFHAGTWETAGAEYYARLLVGPTGGSVSLPSAGAAYVWVKVTDTPEVPVIFAGTVAVT